MKQKDEWQLRLRKSLGEKRLVKQNLVAEQV